MPETVPFTVTVVDGSTPVEGALVFFIHDKNFNATSAIDSQGVATMNAARALEPPREFPRFGTTSINPRRLATRLAPAALRSTSRETLITENRK